MVEQAPIGLLDILSEERFQLINVDLEKCGGMRAPLLDSDSASNELRQPSNCAETAKYGLIEMRNSSQKSRCVIAVRRVEEMPISLSL